MDPNKGVFRSSLLCAERVGCGREGDEVSV